MRRRRNVCLILGVLLVAMAANSSISSAGVGATASDTTARATYTFTGGEQTFTVPSGVTSLTISVTGCRGGNSEPLGYFQNPSIIEADVQVVPGQVLYVEVCSPANGTAGGFNGGGDGSASGGGFGLNRGGGGGGATDVRTISRNASGTLSSRLLVAAGSGGGGGDGSGAGALARGYGGDGGCCGYGNTARPGLNGQSGQSGSPQGSGGGRPGGGGTDTGGGVGGIANGTLDGSFGQGGAGSSPAFGSSGTGGGGGGGWYGGGGGEAGQPTNSVNSGGGGGGGSSFVASTAKATYIDTADVTQLGDALVIYKPAPKLKKLDFGKTILFPAKGIAKLPVTLPGSGVLKLFGKGIVKLPRSLGRDSRSVGFASRKIAKAGTYRLKIKAKGRKHRKLFATGKVRVKALVSFKPTAGKKVTDSKRIRLKYNPGA